MAIRHYLALQPRCLAEHEAALDSYAVAAVIASEKCAPWFAGVGQGFMNELSPGYDAALAKRQLAVLDC